MCVLYAFFRISDDLVDEKKQTIDDKTLALQHWRKNLKEIINNQPATISYPINPALKWVLQEFQLKPEWLLDSLSGAERDLSPIILQTSAQLDEYCYEVAGTVGLSCLAIWGTTSLEAQQLGITCGRAFQRTNILRDLKEDHERDRYYIPSNDIKAQLLSSLQSKMFTPNLSQLIEHNIEITHQYYEISQQLGQLIPSKGGRKMFHGIYNIYYELFQTLKQNPEKILLERISVPKSRKLWHTCQAALKY
jgi:phytoene synthase